MKWVAVLQQRLTVQLQNKLVVVLLCIGSLSVTDVAKFIISVITKKFVQHACIFFSFSLLFTDAYIPNSAFEFLKPNKVLVTFAKSVMLRWTPGSEIVYPWNVWFHEFPFHLYILYILIYSQNMKFAWWLTMNFYFYLKYHYIFRRHTNLTCMSIIWKKKKINIIKIFCKYCFFFTLLTLLKISLPFNKILN